MDVFNSGFCKMYIIITNVSEPGLKINLKGMWGGFDFTEEMYFCGIPLKGSLTVVTGDIAEEQKNETFFSFAVLQ